MAIQTLGAAAVVGSQDGFSLTVTDIQKVYNVAQAFSSGVYNISVSPLNSLAQVTFKNATQGVKTTTDGTTGIITVQISFNATSADIIVEANAGAIVTIDKIAEVLTGVPISGTVDTISATGTYNTTGYMYVMAIGGGGGGSAWSAGYPNTSSATNPGIGGSAGKYAVYGPTFVNTATSVTIGTGGAGTNNANSAGGSGNQTSFGAYAVAAGGAGGYKGEDGPNQQNTNPQNSAGTFGGGGGWEGQNAGYATNTPVKSITNSTTGGGGARGGAGGGSGIGTGGTGATANTSSTAGTGYGAGGGAGWTNLRTSSAGSSGVVYVLRDIS